jgi:hypothetical protein
MRTAKACVVGLTVVLIAPGPSAVAASHTEVVRAITENAGIKQIVGTDLASVTSRFFDPKTHKEIGRNVGYCVTAPTGEQMCTTTVFLPRGQLALIGVYSAASRVIIPIVGGSGHYTDAGGYADIRPRGPMGSNAKFVIITHR